MCVSGLAHRRLHGQRDVTSARLRRRNGVSVQTYTATVIAGTNCTDNQPTGAGVKVTFTNAPLADIQVNFRDGGSGETSR